MGGSEQEERICTVLVEQKDCLYRLAYSYVHNENDAMDIVQETAYKAIKNKNSLKNPEYTKTWLCRILINTALDLLKKRQHEVIGIEDYSLFYEDKHSDFDVQRTLQALEPRERTVIILRFFEDMKLTEIAEATQENLNTVKSRLYRALEKLKASLEGV